MNKQQLIRKIGIEKQHEHFSKALTRIIAERNTTKTAVAREMDCEKTLVYDWVAGKSLPNYVNLMKLCIVLECSADELLFSEEELWGYKCQNF